MHKIYKEFLQINKKKQASSLAAVPIITHPSVALAS